MIAHPMKRSPFSIAPECDERFAKLQRRRRRLRARFVLYWLIVAASIGLTVATWLRG